ncbi:MAG: oxygen-dependent coproporphyrinogen oxidase [Myxococcales bacterium]
MAWQDEVTSSLEELERSARSRQAPARFREDRWERPGGGGGRSRVLEGGAVFERAGVNFSHVHGTLPEALAATMPGDGADFEAVGVSLVLHPLNPMVPTTHANYRRLRRGKTMWIGGGADLTPYVLFDEDARHFHRTLRTACEPGFYERAKEECDRYFFLPHRGETRGVGGIFFDYVLGEPEKLEAQLARLWSSFLPAYRPIVEKRRDLPYGEQDRAFQLWRRGRYVEFNLLYDRGTSFGLSTGGRTESILMSLPPLVRWEYDYQPEAGSAQQRLLEVLRKPRNWAEDE